MLVGNVVWDVPAELLCRLFHESLPSIYPELLPAIDPQPHHAIPDTYASDEHASSALCKLSHVSALALIQAPYLCFRRSGALPAGAQLFKFHVHAE